MPAPVRSGFPSPFLSIQTIQPSSQLPVQVAPSELAHMAAPFGFRTASDRVRLIEAMSSLVAVANLFDRIDD